MKSFRAPPFFVFHWVNAFESEDGRWVGLRRLVVGASTACVTWEGQQVGTLVKCGWVCKRAMAVLQQVLLVF